MPKKLTTNQFIIKAIEKHCWKYNYATVNYENSKLKVKIFCNKCKKYFWQRPNDHLNNHGCPYCATEKVATLCAHTTESFILKARYIHKSKYNYSKIIYKNNKVPIQIYCTSCGTYFWQRPDAHLKGKGCPTCSLILQKNLAIKSRLTVDQFIIKALSVHSCGKFNYALVVYKGRKQKIKIICNTCNTLFIQTVDSHLNGSGCPICNYINHLGPGHPNWKGGKTLEPYCEIWKDRQYKLDIKNRDNNICQNPYCFRTDNIVHIHHIDYDKQNCHPSNLITVCRSCNSRANKDRAWHMEWYQILNSKRSIGVL